MICAGLRLAVPLSRLPVYAAVDSRSISTASGPLCFQVTNALWAEPLKKKKKMDPMLIKAREDRKRKRLEKQIRRMEKLVKVEKPIEERAMVETLAKEASVRQRKVDAITAEEAERRILLEKEWCVYKCQVDRRDTRILSSILDSQEQALEELKAVSEELYNKAIELDHSLVPYKTKGPVHTPPIENYVYPDGDYADVTPKYDGE